MNSKKLTRALELLARHYFSEGEAGKTSWKALIETLEEGARSLQMAAELHPMTYVGERADVRIAGDALAEAVGEVRAWQVVMDSVDNGI